MEINDSIQEKIIKLQEKYATIGQDLDSYLDGLLVSNPLYYWDYIKVDALLSLQQQRTDFPDEQIFIVYHQITELYFHLTLHEMRQLSYNGRNVTDMGQDLGWNQKLTGTLLTERLKRINRYFEALTLSFDIMRTGMDKDQFLRFRMALLPASGFQAANYRRIEICATDLGNLVHHTKREQMKNASVLEQLNNIYWRQGAIIEETGEKTLTLKHFEDKYMDDFRNLALEMEHRNLWKKFQSLTVEEKQNPELIDALKAFDVHVNINWPLVHYKTAARYMARDNSDVAATGGTNWQKYLPPRFQKRIFFPEMWSESERENWGKEWVSSVITKVWE
jgi:tryptophan 2,3-dioxygenase